MLDILKIGHVPEFFILDKLDLGPRKGMGLDLHVIVQHPGVVVQHPGRDGMGGFVGLCGRLDGIVGFGVSKIIFLRRKES